MEAALDLVEEQGVAALTLREVARRVDVTHAAPYRHFKSKSALLAALAEEGFKRLHTTLGEVRRGTCVSDRLTATGVAYLRFALDHPAHYRVMFGSEPEAARSTALRAAARDVMAELQALSSERSGPDDRDGTQWAASLWAQWHGLALLHLGGWLDLHPRAALPKLLAEAVRSSSSAAASATTPLDGPAHLDQHRSGSSLDPSVTDEMTRDDDRR